MQERTQFIAKLAAYRVDIRINQQEQIAAGEGRLRFPGDWSLSQLPDFQTFGVPSTSAASVLAFLNWPTHARVQAFNGCDLVCREIQLHLDQFVHRAHAVTLLLVSGIE